MASGYKFYHSERREMDYSGIDNARFMIRHGSSNGLSQSNSGFAVTGMIRIPEVYTEKNEKSKQ